MIQDVDDTLRCMLEQQIGRPAGAEPLPDVQITFDAPWALTEPAGKKPRVNLYLHDIRENLSLRDESFHVVRPQAGAQAAMEEDWAGIRRAPVRLNLYYLMTVEAAGDTAMEHRLLAALLGVFLRSPVAPKACRSGALAGFEDGSVTTSVAVADEPPHADLTALWRVVGGHFRPSIRLVVTAPYDPFDTQPRRVVREALIGMGQGASPDGPQRPLDLSSVRVSVAGVVTTADGGKPLPGARVSVANRDEVAATDEKGFFSLMNLPAGPHMLTFSMRGHEEREARVVVPPLGRPDQLKVLDVRLPELGGIERAHAEGAAAEAVLNAPGMADRSRVFRVAVSGRLVYADGRPAAYIPVRSGARQSITDADGVYTFSGPPDANGVVATITGLGDVKIQDSDGVSALALPAVGGQPVPESWEQPSARPPEPATHGAR